MPPPLPSRATRSSPMTSPSRMRMIRSQAAPTSGSCVTSSTVWPRSRLKRRSMASTSAARAESRLPVGSSPRMSFGSFTSARAMATRCCSPPDSSIGRWPRPIGQADRAASASRAAVADGSARHARVLRRQRHVLGGGERRHEVEGLEHEAHRAGSDPGAFPIRQGRASAPSIRSVGRGPSVAVRRSGGVPGCASACSCRSRTAP